MLDRTISENNMLIVGMTDTVSSWSVPRSSAISTSARNSVDAFSRYSKSARQEEGQDEALSASLLSEERHVLESPRSTEFFNSYYTKCELAQKLTDDDFVEDYQLKELIGFGGFSTVRRAINIHTNEECAMKIIIKSQLDEEGVLMLQNETTIWSRLHHENIISLRHVYDSTSVVCIAAELAKGGSLLNYVCEQPCGYLKEEVVKPLFKQLVGVLALCHQKGIVHGDVKPENVLLTEDRKSIKLCDFGLSYSCDGLVSPDSIRLSGFDEDYGSNKGYSRSSSYSGTPQYCAPEVIKISDKAGACSDMWSAGVTLFAVLSGRYPFDDEYAPRLQHKIINAEFDMPDHISPDCQDLLRKLLAKDAFSRVSARSALQHPWFNSCTN